MRQLTNAYKICRDISASLPPGLVEPLLLAGWVSSSMAASVQLISLRLAFDGMQLSENHDGPFGSIGSLAGDKKVLVFDLSGDC